jgi:hypothetical protein
MGRLFASLVVAGILAGVLSPLAVALGTASRPACCLPSGKHHCSQYPSGPGFTSKSDQCPYSSEVVVSGFQELEAINFALAAPQVTRHFGVMAASGAYRVAFRELSRATVIELCRKEMPSILKSFKALKVHKRTTFRVISNIESANWPGVS